jgi:serine/threonine protein kinase
MTIPKGESFAQKCLQLNPKKRINATDAMKDPFFCPLPEKVHQLTPGKILLKRERRTRLKLLPFTAAETIFSVPGIKMKPELTTASASALKAAKKIKEKKKSSGD